MASLDVAIIGAGIAGLAAGISICRAGHRVTIYERSQFKNEIGAAINMPPHATLILRKWGLAGPNPAKDSPYKDMASGTVLHSSQSHIAKTAEVPFHTTMEGTEDLYGAPFVSYHRADLHAGLRKLAEDAGAVIKLGQKAVAVDCSTGTLTLSDSASGSNETVQKDLIVVADGVNTEFVKDVAGEHIPTLESGRGAYRALIPAEDLLNDNDANEAMKDGAEHSMNGTLDPQAGLFMVYYPCRSGQLINVAIMHPVKPEGKERDDWNAPATVDEALETISSWHPAFKAVVKRGTFKFYTMKVREPLPTYHNGHAIIIGDAAHPMFPTFAGGGSTALEDAAALEIILRDVKPSDSRLLAQRLSLWNAICLPRDVVVQVLSSALLSPKPAVQFTDQVKHVYTGKLPEQVIVGWHQVTRAVMCPYDAFESSQKAMDWAEKEGYPEDMMFRLQDEGVIQHFGSPS